MTPEQLATLTALAGIVKSIGTWPIMSIIVLVVLGPWLVNAYTSYQQQRRFEQQREQSQHQFDAVVQMYKDNVALVEGYEKVSAGMREQIVWSTQIVSEANSIAKNNLYCPSMRKGVAPKDIKHG
jgi:Flp pilus assembly protein TadB